MTQQIVKQYRVTFQRTIIEEVEYFVYANAAEEAEEFAKKRLCSDDEDPFWYVPDNDWQTDTPLVTGGITEQPDWNKRP